MEKTGQGFTAKHIMIIVSMICMAIVSIGICINAWGVLFVPWAEGIGVGQGAIAFHATISSLVTGLFSPVVAKLLTKIRTKYICIAGVVIMAGSVFMMAFAKNIMVINILGFIRGIGCSCTSFTVLTTVISNWFVKNKSTITGAVFCFSGLAGAFFSPVISSMITAMGYSRALVVLSGIMILLTLPVTVFFLDGSPDECGMKAYGEGETRKEGTAEEEETVPFRPFSMLYILLILSAFLSTPLSAISTHINGYALSIGYSASFGAMLLSIIMFGNSAYKLLTGVITDKIGPFTTSWLMLGMTFSGLAILCFFPGNGGMLALGAGLFGTLYSITTVLLSSITNRLYGRKNYGNAYSYVSGAMSLGTAAATTFFGMLYDMTSSYVYSIILSMGLSVTVAVIIFFIFILYRKQLGRAR